MTRCMCGVVRLVAGGRDHCFHCQHLAAAVPLHVCEPRDTASDSSSDGLGSQTEGSGGGRTNILNDSVNTQQYCVFSSQCYCKIHSIVAC
jgi:hypothetical protein